MPSPSPNPVDQLPEVASPFTGTTTEFDRRSSRLRTVIAKRDGIAAAFIRQSAEQAGLGGEILLSPTAQSALQTLRQSPANVAIVGLTFSDMDGLDLVLTIIRERLAFRILVVSSRRDELVRAQLRPGRINGYFNPEVEDPARLPEVIRRVNTGRTHFSANATTSTGGQTIDQMFTPHQLRVFAVLCATGNEKRAAKLLRLSENTLHDHARRIRRKLGVSRLNELVIEAIRRGVVRISADGNVLRPGIDHETA